MVDNDASNNLIGETPSGIGAANTIAFNAGSGVGIISGTGNSILSNSIFSNAQLGILLSGTGNNAQAAPALTAAIPSSSSSSTFIQGTLNSVPGTSFRIQFFSNAVADPSGYGQGQTLIGAATVVTDTSGSTSFSVTLPIVVAPGLVVSATATNLSTGDTSAFSVDVISSPIDLQFIESSVRGQRVDRPGHDQRGARGQPQRDRSRSATPPAMALPGPGSITHQPRERSSSTRECPSGASRFRSSPHRPHSTS